MTITRATPLADLPELLRVDELACWADCGRGTIYEAIRCGTLPHVRVGRLVRVPRAGLQKWISTANGGTRGAD